MDNGYAFNLADLNYNINAEFYERLQIWPQTMICYAIMEDGSIKVLGIEIKQHFTTVKPPNCDEYLWSTNVKWECKNENDDKL